jgi:putative endonuclease
MTTKNSDPPLPSWDLAETPPPRSSRGRFGEDVAARYLSGKGLQILKRGFRTRCGEIDLIAREGEELVFVEVKCRTSLRCGDPLEAVTSAKRLRILRAATLYLQATGSWDRPCRFDLVAVRLGPGGVEEVEHVRAAFQADS